MAHGNGPKWALSEEGGTPFISNPNYYTRQCKQCRSTREDEMLCCVLKEYSLQFRWPNGIRQVALKSSDKTWMGHQGFSNVPTRDQPCVSSKALADPPKALQIRRNGSKGL